MRIYTDRKKGIKGEAHRRAECRLLKSKIADMELRILDLWRCYNYIMSRLDINIAFVPYKNKTTISARK